MLPRLSIANSVIAYKSNCTVALGGIVTACKQYFMHAVHQSMPTVSSQSHTSICISNRGALHTFLMGFLFAHHFYRILQLAQFTVSLLNVCVLVCKSICSWVFTVGELRSSLH